MSPSILALTAMLWALPGLLAILSWRQWGTMRSVPGGMALLLVLLYGSIWLFWRPTAFEISGDHLTVIFPGRRRCFPLSDVTACRVVSSQQFRSEYGLAVRVGVGGLWGGFGLLWTSRRGWVSFYVSRTDDLLLIDLRGRKPLLITPRRPEAMCQALLSRAGR